MSIMGWPLRRSHTTNAIRNAPPVSRRLEGGEKVKGSVTKKGRRYYVIVEDTDPETGDRKRRWHSGYDTKKEAEAERIRPLS
jgi:hypothetical protein